MDIKLFVIAHKEINNIPDDRLLLGVGDSVFKSDFRDNVGENISEKNNYYCELTALFWIWKNVKSDYVGLEHYRRFFCKNNIFRAEVLSKDNIEKLLKKYDLILPKKVNLKCSVYEQYNLKHNVEDLNLCREIIKDKYSEYLQDYDYVMRLKSISICNMFVMSEAYLYEYCNWLFNILFEAEKKIDLTGRDIYQSRVFGFLSERLFNVWLYHKHLKIFYAPIYNMGDKPFSDKIKNKLKRILKK